MVVEELITDSNQDIMRETDKKNNLIKPITQEDVVRLEDKLCPRTYICATDSRFNYTFCKEEDIVIKNNLPEILERDKIDYGVVIKKGDEETENSTGSLDTTIPLTYYQITEPEEGELWYREKHPNLPEDFYGIIARYTWGQPQTKKSIKNEIKKVKKNPKKVLPQGLSVLKGTFSVSFD